MSPLLPKVCHNVLKPSIIQARLLSVATGHEVDHGERPVISPEPDTRAINNAMDIATANWKAQATRAFITSNIAGVMEELCTSANNFVPVGKIAKSANLNPDATYRLMRFLSTFEVCVESGDSCTDNGGGGYDDCKRFKLGTVGEVLTPNHPQSIANIIKWEASFTSAIVWDKLDDFLKTNKTIVKEATGGEDLWGYFAHNPPVLDLFQKSMTGMSRGVAPFLENPEQSPTLDLSRYSTICDLGAAEGALSLSLTKRFPRSNYILSDLPECVDRIDASTLPYNFTLEATDFLKSVPVADAYVLKHIIHDWDDEHSNIIFRNIHEANPNASIFVFEFGPMPGPNQPHLSKGFDLHMGIFLNSVERTQDEYDALYEKGGFERVRVHYLGNGNCPLYIQEIRPKSYWLL